MHSPKNRPLQYLLFFNHLRKILKASMKGYESMSIFSLFKQMFPPVSVVFSTGIKSNKISCAKGQMIILR